MAACAPPSTKNETPWLAVIPMGGDRFGLATDYDEDASLADRGTATI